MATDDIFASLGGSLMRDILGTGGMMMTDTNTDILSSLEAELDATMSPVQHGGNGFAAAPSSSSGSRGPPGLVSSSSSAAALIVSHQQQRAAQLSNNGHNKKSNSRVLAFDQHAMADFLREDAARKKERTEEEEMRKEVDKVLYDDEEEEEGYDLTAQVNFLPTTATLNNSNNNNNTTMATNGRKSDRTTAGASAPPPPGLMLQKMTAAPNPSSTILPPAQREARPLPGAGVPTAASQMQLPPFQGRPQFQHQHHHPQQQQQPPPPPQPMQMQMHTMNNINQNWNGGHPQQQHQQHRTPADTRPMNYNHNNTMLPPFLQHKSSSNTPQNASPMVSKQQQQQQHPNNPPPQYYAQPQPHFPLVRQQQQQPSRLYFCNPHPRAHPIAATTIPSSSMTPRDLTYVLHAMIRPTTLNPDNYYRMWMRSDLRQKDDDDSVTVRIEKQREFRRSVEERAREWKGEQQVLGHIVKSNVHRPRAMLDLEVSVHHHHHAGGGAGNDDDATARATLWKARKLMDVGYGHLLDGRLEALRACVLGGNDDDDDHHNLTLLLTLPKGRTLVARTLAGMREQGTDDVVSLFRLMPLLVTRLFAHPVMREREDRLLFVCTSAVVTYGGDDSVLTLWIATLEAAMDTAAGDLKKVLGSRPRAEFMHALLTGGAGMCVRNNNGPSEGRWKGAEERFLSMLSRQ